MLGALALAAIGCRAEEPSPDCASYIRPCEDEVQGDVDACLDDAGCVGLQINSCDHKACVAACELDEHVARCIQRESDETCGALACYLECSSDCTPAYIACQTPNVEGICGPNTACTEEFDGCKADCTYLCEAEDPE